MRYIKTALVASVAFVLASCGVPKDITYFQDTSDVDILERVTPRPIKLQPFDKISIIVNTPDAKLSYLFNKPYTTRYIGAISDQVLSSSNQGVSGYTIDSAGEIDFPVVGKMYISGLTREEVASRVKEELVSRSLVKDPVVTVEFMNLYVSIMGEVKYPGRLAINQDHYTIIDAISQAGDLTITGRRDNIRVLRKDGRDEKSYRVDLTDARSVINSPVYYLQQNDIIYVEPNDMRSRQSTVNGNNVVSTSFWISIASLAATITSTIMVVLSSSK